MYDPQLGRFICLDPIADKFVWVSAYNYAENSPISNNDLWGLQAVPFMLMTEWQLFKASVKSHFTPNVKQSVTNIITGQKTTDRIPTEVKADMSSQTKYAIDAVGLTNDIKDVGEAIEGATMEVAKESAKVVKTLGTGTKGLGYVACLGAPEIGLPLVEVGNFVEDIGEYSEAAINIIEGKPEEGLTSAAINLGFGQMGDAIKNLNKTTDGSKSILFFINDSWEKLSSWTASLVREKQKEKETSSK